MVEFIEEDEEAQETNRATHTAGFKVPTGMMVTINQLDDTKIAMDYGMNVDAVLHLEQLITSWKASGTASSWPAAIFLHQAIGK